LKKKFTIILKAIVKKKIPEKDTFLASLKNKKLSLTKSKKVKKVCEH